MSLHQNFKKGQRYNFTVCLEGPFFGGISTDWFVEWMEANIIFGAQKILIHNLSIPLYLEPYINYYERIGLLDVLPWDLRFWPTTNRSDIIRSNLQPMMIVDCQYRLQRYSKYVVFIDIDELIVPRSAMDKTWSDMIDHVSCPFRPQLFGARQLWFFKRSPQVENTNLITQDVMIRHTFIENFPNRSKYIADTTLLETKASVHSVFEGSENCTCVIPPKIGALHHYKQHVSYNETVRDDVMAKYKMELIKRIKLVKGKMQGTLGNQIP